jgi:aquaporin TIP
MQKHLYAEFIGTTLLTFLIGAVSVNSEASGLLTGAVGSGSALAVLIYATAGENGSGGKLNPAVTFGLYVTGRLDKLTAIWEVVVQVLGGFVAGVLLKMAIPHTDLTVPLIAMGGPSTAHPLSTFVWEFIATGFLVFVVFATVVDKQTRHPNLKVTKFEPFAPLAIGLTVIVGSFAAGPFSGAAMNPARALGPALVFWNFTNIWVYLLAGLTGGASGALLYENCFLEHQPPEEDEASV